MNTLLFGNEKVVNPEGIFLYRVLFGLVNVIFAKNTLDQFEILFVPETLFMAQLIKVLLFMWIVLGALFILIRPGKTIVILQYAITLFILTTDVGVHNVEVKFFITASFFNLFVPFQKKNNYSHIDYKLITLYLLGVGSYLLYGGFVTKFEDPVWREGLGIYSVMLLPWIKPKVFNFLIENEFLAISINHIVMLFELLIFPLGIFALTRSLSILLFGSFGFFLCFILHVSTIGLEALAFSVLFFSIFPRRIKIFGWLGHLDVSIPRLPKDLITQNYYRIESGILIILYVAWLVIAGRQTLSSYNLNYYFDKRFKAIDWLNNKTFCIFYDTLFTVKHFQDIEEYRIKVTLKDGTVIEPVRVFNEDKTAGEYSSSIFASRWIQCEMYYSGKDLIYNHIREKKTPPPNVKRLFRYVLGKVDKPGDVKSLQLYTSELKMPDVFREDAYAYVVSDKWSEVLSFNPHNHQYTYCYHKN